MWSCFNRRRPINFFVGVISTLMVVLAPLMPEPCCCSVAAEPVSSDIRTAEQSASQFCGVPGQSDARRCCQSRESGAPRAIPACCHAKHADGFTLGGFAPGGCQGCPDTECGCIEDPTVLARTTLARVILGANGCDLPLSFIDTQELAEAVSFKGEYAPFERVLRGRDLCVLCCRWLI